MAKIRISEVIEIPRFLVKKGGPGGGVVQVGVFDGMLCTLLPEDVDHII